jgi:RpiR family transcriptional regulator, carbohydrate utilization regulator
MTVVNQPAKQSRKQPGSHAENVALTHSAPALQKLQAARKTVGSRTVRVIDYVLAHPNDVIHLSVTEVAELTQASEATIVRLFQNLGFKGYQDFKIRLSQSLVPDTHSIERGIEHGDSINVIFEKVFATSETTLRNTLAHLEPNDLERTVDLIANARRLVFIGVGGSGVVAQDAHHKFLKLGIFCEALPDPHNAAQVCALLDARDVVVAISHSGATKDVLDAARVAKDHGARLIALTKLGNSPLSKISDVTLMTSSPESLYRSEAVASRIAQLCFIDALVVALYLRNQSNSNETWKLARGALNQKRI